jgi:uncharacterized protein YjbJ (UPF0337 family)
VEHQDKRLDSFRSVVQRKLTLGLAPADKSTGSIHLNPAFYRRAVELTFMNSSTTDKVKGTAKEVAGKVKEETGKAFGNPDLRDRGTAEKVAGKVERKVGEVKKVFGK